MLDNKLEFARQFRFFVSARLQVPPSALAWAEAVPRTPPGSAALAAEGSAVPCLRESPFTTAATVPARLAPSGVQPPRLTFPPLFNCPAPPEKTPQNVPLKKSHSIDSPWLPGIFDGKHVPVEPVPVTPCQIPVTGGHFIDPPRLPAIFRSDPSPAGKNPVTPCDAHASIGEGRKAGAILRWRARRAGCASCNRPDAFRDTGRSVLSESDREPACRPRHCAVRIE